MSLQHSNNCYCETCFQLRSHREGACDSETTSELKARVEGPLNLAESGTRIPVGWSDPEMQRKWDAGESVFDEGALENSGLKGRYNPDDVVITMGNGATISCAKGGPEDKLTGRVKASGDFYADGGLVDPERFQVRHAAGFRSKPEVEHSIVKTSAGDFHQVKILEAGLSVSTDLLEKYILREPMNTLRSLASPTQQPYISIDPDRKLECIELLMRQEFTERVERKGCTKSDQAALTAMRTQLMAIFEFLEKTK